jgi:hypothetical protein
VGVLKYREHVKVFLGLDDGDALHCEALVEWQVFFMCFFLFTSILFCEDGVPSSLYWFSHLALFIQQGEIMLREGLCSL